MITENTAKLRLEKLITYDRVVIFMMDDDKVLALFPIFSQIDKGYLENIKENEEIDDITAIRQVYAEDDNGDFIFQFLFTNQVSHLRVAEKEEYQELLLDMINSRIISFDSVLNTGLEFDDDV